MRSLALYCNSNGEGRSCLIEHDSVFDITAVDLTPILPEFEDGILFLIHGFAHDYADGAPNITDGYGQDCQHYRADIRGARISEANEIAQS